MDQNKTKNVGIRFYSPEITFLGEIDNYFSFFFIRRWNTYGQFEFHVRTMDTKKIKRGNLIMFGKDGYRSGVITRVEINENRKKEVIVTGYDLRYYLERRITAPVSGKAYDTFNCNVEEIMRGMITHNAIAPENTLRVIPRLVLAKNGNKGQKTTFQTRYKKLDEELKTLSETSRLGTAVFLDVRNKTLVFEILEGVDRTQSQTERPPYLFTKMLDRINQRNFVDSDNEYKNVCYTAGQGEGENREIFILNDDCYSGYDRRELFVDARDIGDDAEATLEDRAKQKMVDYPLIRSFNCIVKADDYEKKWFLGDYVTIKDEELNILEDHQILSVKETYESKKRKIEPVFGEALQGIGQKVKKTLANSGGSSEPVSDMTRAVFATENPAEGYVDKAINADTATALKYRRMISMTGDVGYTEQYFDGTENIAFGLYLKAITTAQTGAVKVNYDSKGRVTGSSPLSESDIPSLSITKLRDLSQSYYDKTEIDNQFSLLETNVDWKESVNTFADIATAYPYPQDGWTVNVKDTDYTYRYSGTEWVAISANAIPKATETVDGLMSRENVQKLNDVHSDRHTHSNKSLLDTITQTLMDAWNSAVAHIADTVKHITSAERTKWNTVDQKADKFVKSGADFNTLTDPGLYTLSGGTVTNGPVSGNYFSVLVLQSTANSGSYVQQIAFKEASDSVVYIRKRSSSWGPWKVLAVEDGTYPNMTAGTAQGLVNALKFTGAVSATFDGKNAVTVNIPSGGGSSVTVVDNLTSTSATAALSANQGRVLETGKAPYKVMSSTDFNTMTTPGMYTMRSCSTNAPPSGTTYHSLYVNKSDNGTYLTQIACPETKTDLYIRRCTGSTWSAWEKLLKASEGASLKIQTAKPTGDWSFWLKK